MAATIGVNLFVSWYEAREGRRLKSAFLVADATHTRADLYVSLGVVASFVAALAGLGWADPLVAVAIAAIIAWQALQILGSAFNVLTDRAVIPAERLEPLAAAVPGVLRVHDARSRGRRDAVYVDLTVHLDGGMSLHRPTASPIASRPSCRRPTPRSWTSSSTSSPRATRARRGRWPDGAHRRDAARHEVRPGEHREGSSRRAALTPTFERAAGRLVGTMVLR